MSYAYPESSEERAARVLLEKAGYSVHKPTCPDCHGMGTIGTWEAWQMGQTASGSFTSKPCPRGCPSPVLVL